MEEGKLRTMRRQPVIQEAVCRVQTSQDQDRETCWKKYKNKKIRPEK